MKLSPKLQGNLIMLLVMIIFGLNVPVNKYLYAHELVSPLVITTLRMSFAAAMFWLVSLFLPKEKVERKDMVILLVGGLFGMILNQGLFAYGLSRTSPVDAPLIATSVPLFAMIIAAIILKEPITLKKAGGVAIGIVGAVFLIYSSHTVEAGSGDMLGNISIVGSAFFYAFYLVITRPLSLKYSPITMMKWMFLVSSLAILPFGAKSVVSAPLFRQTETMPYLFLAFVLIAATFITYMLIPFAQQRIRATTISMYNNVQPVVASLVAISIGMDVFTTKKLLAGLLIFVGVYLVTQSKSKADMDAELVAEGGKSVSS